jgi:hypothetical protein
MIHTLSNWEDKMRNYYDELKNDVTEFRYKAGEVKQDLERYYEQGRPYYGEAEIKGQQIISDVERMQDNFEQKARQYIPEIRYEFEKALVQQKQEHMQKTETAREFLPVYKKEVIETLSSEKEKIVEDVTEDPLLLVNPIYWKAEIYVTGVKLVPVYDEKESKYKTINTVAKEMVSRNPAWRGSDLYEDPLRVAVTPMVYYDYLLYAKLIQAPDGQWVSIAEAVSIGYKTAELTEVTDVLQRAKFAYAMEDAPSFNAELEKFADGIKNVNDNKESVIVYNARKTSPSLVPLASFVSDVLSVVGISTIPPSTPVELSEYQEPSAIGNLAPGGELNIFIDARSWTAASSPEVILEREGAIVIPISPEWVEYRVNISQDDNYYLTLNAKDDFPPPVRIGVSIDGDYLGEIELKKGDERYHTRQIDVGILHQGMHTIKITYLEDFALSPDKDRDLFLKWLQVGTSGATTSFMSNESVTGLPSSAITTWGAYSSEVKLLNIMQEIYATPGDTAKTPIRYEIGSKDVNQLVQVFLLIGDEKGTLIGVVPIYHGKATNIIEEETIGFEVPSKKGRYNLWLATGTHYDMDDALRSFAGRTINIPAHANLIVGG